MKIEGEGQRLRVYCGETDRFEGKPLYEAIVLLARERGLAGATVFRGGMGFGANSRIHTTKVLRLSESLPMVIEIVDRVDRIQGFIPEVNRMLEEGMITVEEVHVITYRHRR
jgi:PII-like signaling protein